MSVTILKKVVMASVLVLGLSASAASFAHGGGHGGGHGGWHGGGWHGGGWHGGGWHGGGWHGGGWHGGGWGGGGWGGGWGPGIVVGVPYSGYYPACETIRVCNRHGHCWLRRACY